MIQRLYFFLQGNALRLEIVGWINENEVSGQLGKQPTNWEMAADRIARAIRPHHYQDFDPVEEVRQAEARHPIGLQRERPLNSRFSERKALVASFEPVAGIQFRQRFSLCLLCPNAKHPAEDRRSHSGKNGLILPDPRLYTVSSDHPAGSG